MLAMSGGRPGVPLSTGDAMTVPVPSLRDDPQLRASAKTLKATRPSPAIFHARGETPAENPLVGAAGCVARGGAALAVLDVVAPQP
jgi:hypothetical protein